MKSMSNKLIGIQNQKIIPYQFKSNRSLNISVEITDILKTVQAFYLQQLWAKPLFQGIFLKSRIIEINSIKRALKSVALFTTIIKYLMGAASIEKVNKIPTGLSADSAKKREVLFAQFDVNGNKYLSLAEIDKGIRDVLDLPELFQTKPVIMRAYQAAKGKIKAAHTFGDDYVSKAEFRYLLIYLKQYYSLWMTFETIETTGDRRISKQQFVNGKTKVEEWGIKIKNPQATFDELCKKYNEQSQLTFTDFCDWACKEHLKNHPDSDEHDHLY